MTRSIDRFGVLYKGEITQLALYASAVCTYMRRSAACAHDIFTQGFAVRAVSLSGAEHAESDLRDSTLAAVIEAADALSSQLASSRTVVQMYSSGNALAHSHAAFFRHVM